MKLSPGTIPRRALLGGAIALVPWSGWSASSHAQVRERRGDPSSQVIAVGVQSPPQALGPDGRGAPGGPRDQRREVDPGGVRGDGPGRRERDEQGGPFWQQVPTQRRQQCLRFIEEHFPRLSVEMNRMHEEDPQRFRQRMRRIFPDILRMMEVHERDPRMGSLLIRERQLDMQIHYTAMRFHRTDEPVQQDQLRKELKGLVEEAFDVQLERRALEIASLESRLGQLKSTLTEQEKAREALIKQRAQRILERRPPWARPGDEPRNAPQDDLFHDPPREEPPGD